MSKTILVIDDSGSFRTVVKLALQKAGYTVIEAVDGQDAVGKLTGAKPYLAANLRSLPVRSYLEWLEYCNAPAGSTSLATSCVWNLRRRSRATFPRRMPP